jgi:dodecin
LLRRLVQPKEESVAVVKIIELVGSSKTSTDDAAKQALAEAQSSLRNIRAVDIVSTGIRGENLDEYRAHVRIAFIVESDVD